MTAEPFNKDNAAELGRKGGLKSAETRRKRAQRRADEKLRDKLEREVDDLGDALLDAAFGRNGFDDLSSKDRLQAIKTAIDYGIGKPRQVSERGDVQDPEEDRDEPDDGIAFDLGADTSAGTQPEPDTDPAE